ncbi:MAG: 6-phosphofructokinase [Chloroflexi bacterium]|nr:6-phosphofructokinase [Chloroflexota bacterium]
MKRIAVLTSGGDAPGMNSCLRAVVRGALAEGWEVLGVRQGYQGLIDGRMDPLDARAVGGIVQKGGTILGTIRSPEFKTMEGRKRALENLNKNKVEALVVIGGNGSQSGAYELHKMGFPVIGAPSTIDNDVPFTDITIGVDTALNTVLNAIDKIKETASSHHRAFLIEVMGRDSGYLAMMSGIAGGAEFIVIPEVETDMEDIVESVEDAYRKGKAHFIAIIAEGAKPGTQAIADYLRGKELGFEVRMTILGHVQRGGSPTAFDRVLATRLGLGAIRELARAEKGKMVGLIRGETVATPLEEVTSTKKVLDLQFYRRAQVLER